MLKIFTLVCIRYLFSQSYSADNNNDVFFRGIKLLDLIQSKSNKKISYSWIGFLNFLVCISSYFSRIDYKQIARFENLS